MTCLHCGHAKLRHPEHAIRERGVVVRIERHCNVSAVRGPNCPCQDYVPDVGNPHSFLAGLEVCA